MPSHLKLKSNDDPVFKFYARPFSKTTYYNYLDAFLTGLKLDSFFAGSDACVLSIVYTVDDGSYLFNNLTDFSWATWEAPIMNISKAISGNFSKSLVDCETMVENAIAFG